MPSWHAHLQRSSLTPLLRRPKNLSSQLMVAASLLSLWKSSTLTRDDEQVCLVNNSDSEPEECKSAFPFVSTDLKLSFRICIMVSSPCKYINPHSVLISLCVLT